MLWRRNLAGSPNPMKSHWEKIAIPNGLSAKSGGSEDQSGSSDLSVFSDLAGNLFNDYSLPTGDDDSKSNGNDSSDMSIRMTIDEDDDEDDDCEAYDYNKDEDDDDEDGDENEADKEDNEDEDQYDYDDHLDDEDEDEGLTTRDYKKTDEEDLDEDDSTVEDRQRVERDEDEDTDNDGEEVDRDDYDNEYEDEEESSVVEGQTNVEAKATVGFNDAGATDHYDASGLYDSEYYDDPETGDIDSQRSLDDILENQLQRSRQSDCSSVMTQTEVPPKKTYCDRLRACRYPKGQYPVVIVFLTLLDWSFYLGGIMAMKPLPNITLLEPLSPSLASFPFYTIHFWPSCSANQEHWRLISSQFTHQGVRHIGGYTALGLIYGVLLELTHPHHSIMTAVVYQTAVIFGCLGHSFISPFDGLIGCSTGIYGLVGCCISHIILNKDKVTPRAYLCVGIILALQGVLEIIAYFIWYSTSTAYAAHWTSLFSGIFIGLSLGITEPKIWKRVLGALGISAFCIMSIFLIIQYSSNVLNALSFHLFNGNFCCLQLFDLVTPTVSLLDARETFTCDASSMRLKR